MKDWIKEAKNAKHWKQLTACLLDPTSPLPDRPTDWNRRRTSGRQQTRTSNTSNNSAPPSPPPSPQQRQQSRVPPRQRRQQQSDANSSGRPYDPDMVGHSLHDSFKVLDLGIGASEMEVKVQFRKLSRIYHPDKHNSSQTGMANADATAFFQLINNAYSYLKEVT